MAEERKTQPRFSQFALATARDTSAFDTKTVRPEIEAEARAEPPSPAEPAAGVGSLQADELSAPDRSQTSSVAETAKAAPGPATIVPSPSKRRAGAPPAQAETDEELVSFTVRLPASLYMRMRRSLALREKLGELCVAAITRELNLRS